MELQPRATPFGVAPGCRCVGEGWMALLVLAQLIRIVLPFRGIGTYSLGSQSRLWSRGPHLAGCRSHAFPAQLSAPYLYRKASQPKSSSRPWETKACPLQPGSLTGTWQQRGPGSLVGKYSPAPPSPSSEHFSWLQPCLSLSRRGERRGSGLLQATCPMAPALRGPHTSITLFPVVPFPRSTGEQSPGPACFSGMRKK